jgi:hypothetical protein
MTAAHKNMPIVAPNPCTRELPNYRRAQPLDRGLRQQRKSRCRGSDSPRAAAELRARDGHLHRLFRSRAWRRGGRLASAARRDADKGRRGGLPSSRRLTMLRFNADTLNQLRAAREVSIRTEEHPDSAVVIWVVVADGPSKRSRRPMPRQSLAPAKNSCGSTNRARMRPRWCGPKFCRPRCGSSRAKVTR